MRKFWTFFRERPLNILLLAIPLVLYVKYAHWGSSWVLIFSALGVVPLAGLIGEATEALASRTGARVGGLLNATLGNAAELIITIIAIKEGLLELVKASITGSIIGNLLLVMGMAMVLGGVKHGEQRFDRRQASNNSILLTLAVLAMLVPSLINASIPPTDRHHVETLSLALAGVMITLYALGILYGLRSGPDPLAAPSTHQPGKELSVGTALIILALSTFGVAWMSELLVEAVEPVVIQWGVSEFFLGVILIPIVGNVAEHLVAVQVAGRNQMDLSVEIAVASSLQIALFVAPVLVFVSLLFGQHLKLIFHPFELLAIGASVGTVVLVSFDGTSNWLEGAALLTVYVIFGMAFLLL
ncbi:MAG: calcium/proton exchanger [Chloroflexota bacterium]